METAHGGLTDLLVSDHLKLRSLLSDLSLGSWIQVFVDCVCFVNGVVSSARWPIGPKPPGVGKMRQQGSSMARRTTLTEIETEMYYCERVSHSAGAQQVFKILGGMGCDFFDCWPNQPLKNFNDAINEDGDIEVGTGVLQDDLAIESVSFTSRGSADIAFISEYNALSVGQSAGLSPKRLPGFHSRKETDELAAKQEEFAEKLFVNLAYIWLDRRARRECTQPKNNSVAETEVYFLGQLFWIGLCERDRPGFFAGHARLEKQGDRTLELQLSPTRVIAIGGRTRTPL